MEKRKIVLILLVIAAILFATAAIVVLSTSGEDNTQKLPGNNPTQNPTQPSQQIPSNGFGAGVQGYTGDLGLPVVDLRVK